VYLRIPFEVEDPDDYEGLALYMRYDDGFVAYLNGALMASRNAPESLKWNSGATKQNKDEDASKSELFKVGRSLRGLKKGRNVLAIHALNAGGGEPNESNTGCTSSDMLILPELIALRKDKELPEEASPREPSPHDLVVEEEEIKGTVSPAEGRFGEAYKFGDGSLEIGSKNKFALADQELTVSLWFTRRPDSADGQARRLISAGAGSDEKPGWALWVMTRGEGISFAVSDGSRRHAITFKDDSLLNGRWHHAAATVDRQSNMLRLFLNGQLVADQRVDALEGLTVGSHSGLSVGKNSDDTQFHRGMIDDVVLWRRALLPEEIEEVFEADKPAGDLLDAE
jgi:hypothetical protein